MEIRRAAMPEKVTLVIFSGELDKALAAFNIAINSSGERLASDYIVPCSFSRWQQA
jgi:hypothetical protein